MQGTPTVQDMQRIAREKVYNIAQRIYAEEISDNVPDLNTQGRPTNEYLERFDYLSDNLKSAVKRAAGALQCELEADGITINLWNCENEIYDALKCFTK